MPGMPFLLTLVLAALGPAEPPTVAPPDPTPATGPAAAPSDQPATPETPTDAATAPPTATPAAATPPRQVWVFIDRWKEFGGTVESETETELVVVSPIGERRTFNRSQVLDVVDLVRPQPGQRGLIQMRDGSIVRGEILKDTFEGVEFRADSIKGNVPREQVYRVVLEMDFETRYRRIKASILPEEHGRRVALARWLAGQERLDLGIKELEELLAEADSEAARELLRDFNARLALEKAVTERKRRDDERRRAAAPKDAVDGPAAPPSDDGSGTQDPDDGSGARGGMPGSRDLLPDNLITDEDVNLIRVYEIDFRDPPRILVQPEGIRQLILRYGSSDLVPTSTEARNALFTAPAIRLVRLLFDLRARDLYRYIEVQEDPASIARFRTRVHNSWLLGNCATSRCHGGVKAGSFFLHTGKASDARIRYTNLLTLLNTSVDGKPMVNFQDPPDSLLVQYAMQRNLAKYPHPDVPGWKPVFNRGTPQLMADTLEWIRGMHQPRPEYPVAFELPQLDAPDRPVREPDGPDR